MLSDSQLCEGSVLYAISRVCNKPIHAQKSKDAPTSSLVSRRDMYRKLSVMLEALNMSDIESLHTCTPV